jgi:hypothetical protein
MGRSWLRTPSPLKRKRHAEAALQHSRILAAELRRAFIADLKRGRLDIRRVRYDQGRASSNRSCFWYCSGVMEVIALNWRWNADKLICAIKASSSIRTGSAKRARKVWIALIRL